MIKDKNKKEILSSFLENIGCLADSKYQERVWIRREGPECDDIDDTVCDFFDEDYILGKYKDFGITNIQIKLLLNLHEKLRKFTDSFHVYSGKRTTEQLINLPEWVEIREIAKGVLKAFDYKSSEDKKNSLKAYLKDIYDTSNKECQIQEWILAEGPECGDYDEIRCRIFEKGDLILENYKDFGITDSQYQIMKKFRDRYYAFSRAHSWPPEFSDIPEWAEIREIAKEVLKAFDYKP